MTEIVYLIMKKLRRNRLNILHLNLDTILAELDDGLKQK